MKKFVVEMAVSFGATVYVEASNEFEATQKASALVLRYPSEYFDDDVEVDQINYVSEVK